MTTATALSPQQPDLAALYDRDGFVFPLDIVSQAEAEAIRADLEAAEAELADDAERLAMLRAYPGRLLPSFDKLIRNETLIAAASSVLGPDLLVWSTGLFIKEANSPKIVSWHQDLTYWGLDDAEETTLWVALSPANKASGCMKFVPGSHKQQIVPHTDTFDENNLLTRGQEVMVEVDEKDGVSAELMTGQASMHHGHLIHGSGPNTTGDRRIGTAIRYIKTSMKQQTGDKSLVSHVSGEDRFGHFNIGGPPKGRLHDDDFAQVRTDVEIKKRVLYEGAEDQTGQRYK